MIILTLNKFQTQSNMLQCLNGYEVKAGASKQISIGTAYLSFCWTSLAKLLQFYLLKVPPHTA